LGAQDSIGGGGRYDGLIEECGGPPTPGIGFGIGTERCLLVLDQLGVDTSTEPDAPTAFLVCLGDAAKTAAVGILHRLRQAGVAADMDYCGRSMRGQMRAAGKCEARHAVIIGDSELERGVAAVKNLIASSEQHEVALADLAGYLARPTEGA
jgi:histidyl-tRNA synthetase